LNAGRCTSQLPCDGRNRQTALSHDCDHLQFSSFIVSACHWYLCRRWPPALSPRAAKLTAKSRPSAKKSPKSSADYQRRVAAAFADPSIYRVEEEHTLDIARKQSPWRRQRFPMYCFVSGWIRRSFCTTRWDSLPATWCEGSGRHTTVSGTARRFKTLGFRHTANTT
jgi:hypothetical protein